MRISDWSSDVCFSDLRSEGHDMLGPVVPEIATVMTTENGARVAEQSGAFHLANLGPARGAVGGDMALLPGAPERAEDRGRAADAAAGAGARARLVEDVRRGGVVAITQR